MRHRAHSREVFTKKSSPLNCALIVDEFIRNSKDKKKTAYVAMLDAKSAFDVVSHPHLMRKLYNIGVQDQLWTIIDDLHDGAKSSVKWKNEFSDSFPIYQGVRQGGILSATCINCILNDLLEQVKASSTCRTDRKTYLWGAPLLRR